MDLSILNDDAESLFRSLGEFQFLDGAASYALAAVVILAAVLKAAAFIPIAVGTCQLLIRRWKRGLLLILIPTLMPYVLLAVASAGPYFSLWFLLIGSLSAVGFLSSRKIAAKVREKRSIDRALPHQSAGVLGWKLPYSL